MKPLTPKQVRALAAGDPGEEGEAEALRECDECGEPLGHEARAELAKDGKRVFVHAEPCGTDLIARGWEVA